MSRTLMFMLVVLMPSCALSKNPLSDPDKAQLDHRLLGVWECLAAGEEKPGEGEYAFSFVGRSDLPGAPAGLMELITVESNSEGLVRVNKGSFFFATSLNGKSYVSLVELGGSDPGKFRAWDKSRILGYIIAMCTIR